MVSTLASTFAWLDTSERDRRRALDVIDLFALRDTRDELGIAAVRDSWADRLAPGTSTIQTRARYFLFIPWIYQRLQGSGRGTGPVEAKARRHEIDLIAAILASDEDGVPIGARAGRGLQRLPSTIYWNGLGRLGIRLWPGSQAAFHRALAGLEHDPWHPHLPPPPEDFPQRVVLALRSGEAQFLLEQVRSHATDSLLRFLMELDEFAEGPKLPWEHPARSEFPPQLAGWVGHAEAFAVVMHGAALLYNLMLAERLRDARQADPKGLAETYRERLSSWSQDLLAWKGGSHGWDRAEFWQRTRELAPRLPSRTEGFCEVWIERALAARNPEALASDSSARDLVERREGWLKKNRSRLRHREHLEQWGGAAGADRIDYRWGITQRLVRDVQEGRAKA